MDVFHMTYVRNATFHTKKLPKKHHVYEDKSDTRRKVVKVRKTLIWSYFLYQPSCSKQFCQISVYVILLQTNHELLQKNFTKILEKNGKK